MSFVFSGDVRVFFFNFWFIMKCVSVIVLGVSMFVCFGFIFGLGGLFMVRFI